MTGALTPPAPLRVPRAAAGLVRHRHARPDSHMGGRMDGRMDSHMDGRLDAAWTAAWMGAWMDAWTAAWHLPGWQIRHQNCEAACQRGNLHPRPDETVFVRKAVSPQRHLLAGQSHSQGSLRACGATAGFRGRARRPGSMRPRLSLHPQNHGGLQWPGAFHRPWAPGVFWPCAHHAGQCFFPASPPTAAWCGACTAQKAASAS